MAKLFHFLHSFELLKYLRFFLMHIQILSCFLLTIIVGNSIKLFRKYG